ncbi:hypothetical protein BN1708_016908, partial [Verticillium longisporum]
FDTARWVFLDTLGCGLEGLRFKECTKLLGPIVPGTTVPNGPKVPGTDFQLDPVNAAFNIGAMIRWLDYNDCWLAAEWGHPSDNLGAILAVADWITRTNKAGGNLANGKQFTIRDVLEAMIKAHEIQGCLALLNSYNKGHCGCKNVCEPLEEHHVEVYHRCLSLIRYTIYQLEPTYFYKHLGKYMKNQLDGQVALVAAVFVFELVSQNLEAQRPNTKHHALAFTEDLGELVFFLSKVACESLEFLLLPVRQLLQLVCLSFEQLFHALGLPVAQDIDLRLVQPRHAIS